MSERSIIESGGKQFVVAAGSVIRVPKLTAEPGSTVTLTDLLERKRVTAAVLAHGRAPKIRVVKFHNKTRSYRRRGHRQGFTELRIAAIKAS